MAVYDGHGGAEVSELASSMLPRMLAEELKTLVSGTQQSVIEAAIVAAFLKTDRALHLEMVEREAAGLLKRSAGAIGTTVAGVLWFQRNFYVVNLGDSTAAIMEKTKGILVQSAMHKPGARAEEQRIISAGGWVSPPMVVHHGPMVTEQPARVKGILAVSRSLGDWMFEKQNPDAPLNYPIADDAQAVVSKVPTIQCLPGSVVENTDFLVLLATDGLTDIQSLTEVHRHFTWHGETPAWRFESFTGFLNTVYKPDNTTVLVVAFDK